MKSRYNKWSRKEPNIFGSSYRNAAKTMKAAIVNRRLIGDEENPVPLKLKLKSSRRLSHNDLKIISDNVLSRQILLENRIRVVDDCEWDTVEQILAWLDDNCEGHYLVEVTSDNVGVDDELTVGFENESDMVKFKLALG